MNKETWDIYQKEAWKTAIYPNKGKDLSYPALGLTGEVAELMEKIWTSSPPPHYHISKEIGDCFWYINALCKTLNLELVSLVLFASTTYNSIFMSEEEVHKTLICAVGMIAQKAKKITRDEKGIPSTSSKNYLQSKLATTISMLTTICFAFNLDLERVLCKNIEALKRRQRQNKLHGDGDDR